MHDVSYNDLNRPQAQSQEVDAGGSEHTSDGHEGCHEAHTSSKRLRDVKNLFRKLDRDHSGHLEAADLQAALQDIGLPHQSQQYVELLMHQYRSKNAQGIDFEDFLQYLERKDRDIEAAFKKIDEDNSGTISANDLEKALKRKWLPIDHMNTSRMIHLLDKDGDDVIDLEEFRAFAVLLPETQVSDNGILDGWRDSSEWAEGLEYNFASVPPKPSLSRMVASGLAGGLSKSFVAPVDRLRIMMMADRQNHSLRMTALKMWKDGNWPGLFRGNMATVLKIVPQTATQFVVYDWTQARMLQEVDVDADGSDPRLKTAQYALAGGMAGAAASLVSYPLETVRTQMSVCSKLPMHKIAREIGMASGIRGYYRGMPASLSNSIVSNALGFAAYEAFTDAYRKHTGISDPGAGVKGFCAGLSATVIMAVVMPAENVERRLQVQGRDNYPTLYSGTFDCVKRMYKAEGLTAFWRGSLASFAKVAPSLAIVRGVYELGMRLDVKGGTRQYRDVTDPPEPVHTS